MTSIADRPAPPPSEVLLGTVAIEPNRWGTLRTDRSPEVDLLDWVDDLAHLDVDGIEIWEGHLAALDADGVATLSTGGTPIRIVNSYVDFDRADDGARRSVARTVADSGARGVKFNVGNDAASESLYAERIAGWLEMLPPEVTAICECHQKISIAEDPAVARRIFEAAGPASRVQALVHTHDSPQLMAAKFDAYGDRITHVHVNHLDFATMAHPTLAAAEDELHATVVHLHQLGFGGSWTLEFVAGLLTDHDHPAALIAQAGEDLRILRRLLEQQ